MREGGVLRWRVELYDGKWGFYDGGVEFREVEVQVYEERVGFYEGVVGL